MYRLDTDYYEGFGIKTDFDYDPDDPMRFYNRVKEVMMDPNDLPLSKQVKLKRIHDGLCQKKLGLIVRLPASTISLIENGERLIMKNRWKEFETYLFDMWFQDGELIDMRGIEREYSAEEVEEERARLKKLFDTLN